MSLQREVVGNRNDIANMLTNDMFLIIINSSLWEVSRGKQLTIIELQGLICKNPTHSTAFCQRKFEAGGFHLKHSMDKVYAGLRSAGRSSQQKRLRIRLVPLGFETGGSVHDTASSPRSDIELRPLENRSAKGSLKVRRRMRVLIACLAFPSLLVPHRRSRHAPSLAFHLRSKIVLGVNDYW